jgi:D-serine deaminase-like pyridoxal phosphate-dependent protein
LAEIGEVCVAVDNLENARQISKATSDKGMKIDVLIEIDVGTHRCGLPPGKPVQVFAKELEKYRGLRIKGLMAYEGFCSHILDFKEREKACKVALDKAIQTRDLLLDSDINIEVVSAGTTGTYKICANHPGITEIRAGSYILSSATHKAISPEFEVAFTLLSTVISMPSKNRAIIDAGRNSISHDLGLPLVEGLEGVKLRSLWDEHGVLEIKNFDSKLDVGDKIELVPTHPCTTIGLHDKMFCIKDDVLEFVWDIKTRGKFF